MKKKLLLVCMALLSLVGASAQVPVNSTTNGSDVWYYIKGMRGPTTNELYATAQFDNTKVMHKNLTCADDQLWKVVTNGAGLALVNKKYGTYMNADAAYNNGVGVGTVVNAPTAQLTIELSTSTETAKPANSVTIYKTGAPGTFRLHANSGATSGWFNFNSINSFCSFSFILSTTNTTAVLKTGLQNQIAYANAHKTKLVIRTNPGFYSQATVDAFTAAIATAQAVYDNATATDADVLLATNNLVSATNTATQSTNTITFSAADGSSTTWYAIKNTYGSLSRYLKDAGVDVNVANASIPTSEDFLWKFIDNGNGTVQIISKKNAGHISTPPATWDWTNTCKIIATQQDYTLSIIAPTSAQFYIDGNNGGLRRLHLHGGGTLIAYDWTGINTEAAFMFEEGPSKLATWIADAESIYSVGPEGTNPGQYPTAVMAAFRAAIDNAIAVNNNVSSTDAEKSTAWASLGLAKSNFLAAVTVVTSSTGASPVWYRIKSACLASALPALSGKFITTALNDTIMTLQTTTDTDYQLWRFEKQVSGSYYIYNKGISKYIQLGRVTANNSIWVGCNGSVGLEFVVQSMGEGRFTFTKTAKKDGWDMLYANTPKIGGWIDNANYQSRWAIESIVPKSQTITFDDIAAKQVGDADFSLGATTNAAGLALTYVSSDEGIATVSAAGLVHITASAAGTTNITVSQAGNPFYSAATPVMKVLTVGGPNGLKTVDGQVTVTAKNRMLVITGTAEKAQAFTVTGAQVDATKALNAGIYIVKVAGKTLKVNVQ